MALATPGVGPRHAAHGGAVRAAWLQPGMRPAPPAPASYRPEGEPFFLEAGDELEVPRKYSHSKYSHSKYTRPLVLEAGEELEVHMHMLCTCFAHAMHMLCTCYAHAVHMLCTCYAHAVHMLI